MFFAEKIIHFIQRLQFPITLTDDIEVMNPFMDKETLFICKTFYRKFYNDNDQRRMIIGINPGRFGGGVTGIPFTDSIRLEKDCGIETHLRKSMSFPPSLCMK